MTAIVIPGYDIQEQLGLGGMAKVYRARHINLDRDVAIKVMDPSLNNDPTFTERFKREARISAQLTHPHIVQVYDVNSLDGINYLAMEYVGNGDLVDIIQQPLQLDTVYDVVLQITHALDYASSRGYVHRDIKPSNILIRENGTFVLADFGIARATESNTQMTVTGSVIGTPSYMSPEQAQGLQLDGRSDLYSLAIVCFELINKDLPFKSESSISTALKHLRDPIPTLPAELAEFQPFFNKAMAKDREDRFQTGAEMAAALGQLLESAFDQTVIAKPASAVGRIATPIGNSGVHAPLSAWNLNDSPQPGRPNTPPPSPGANALAQGHSGVNSTVQEPEDDEATVYQARPVATKVPPLDGSDDTPQDPTFVSPKASERLLTNQAGKQKPAAQKPSRRGKWIAAASVLVIVGAAATTWFFLDPESKSKLSDSLGSALLQDDQSDEQNQRIATLLAKAGAAYDADKFFQPRGRSAYDYYTQVLDAEPDNGPASAGLNTLLNTAVDRAITLTNQGELELAQEELSKAELISSTDKQLLNAKTALDDAISASLEAISPPETEQIDQPDSVAIPDQLALEASNNDTDSPAESNIALENPILETADANTTKLSEEAQLEVSELLVEAQLNLKQSDIDAQDKARLAYLQVLTIDPQNSEANDGLALLLGMYMATAQLENEKGNFTAARRALEGARAINPEAQLETESGSIADILQQGQSHENDGNYKEAVMIYLEALLLEPANADIDASLHRVAGLYITSIKNLVANNDMEKATALQQEATKWFPNNEELSQALQASGNSESIAENAVEQWPAAAEESKPTVTTQKTLAINAVDDLENSEKIAALLELGDNFLEQEIYTDSSGDSAYSAYKKVLDIDPENEHASKGISKIAYHFANQVKHDLAADDVAAAKENLDSLKQIGTSDMAATMLEKKIRKKETALAAENSAKKKLNDITSQAYKAIEQDNFEAASALYKEASALAPDTPEVNKLQSDLVEAYHNSSMTQLSNQQYNDAIVIAEQGLLFAPGDESLIAVKADAESAQSLNNGELTDEL